MFTQLRAPDHLPAPPMSTDKQPLFDCPKCGVRLHTHSGRTDMDAIGQPEQVFVYLCFADGLFTFRNSQGLAKGL
jgi:hypothetical protein